MAVEVKRTTEIRISGKNLKPLILMAQVVREMIIEGGGDEFKCDRPDVRQMADWLISIGYRYEED